MNLRILFFSVIVSAASVNAGSFGGPPPFTNGSPLPTGTDGKYQAVGTGTNLTGLFAFEISGGTQTSTSANNSWVFFVDGNVLTGGTQANISEGKVAGVLDPSATTNFTNADGTLNGSVAYIVPGNAASGFFKGDINLNSPVAAFSGSGKLTGTPARTDQLVYIMDLSNFDSVTLGAGFSPVIISAINIPGSTFPEAKFDFRGTRLAVGTSSSSSSSSSTTSTQ